MTPFTDASLHGGRSRAGIRFAVACVAAMDAVFFTEGTLVAPGGNPDPWLPAWILVGLCAVVVAAALLFARGRFVPWSPLLALIAIAPLAEAHARTYGPAPEPHLSGVALLGWLLGLAWWGLVRTPGRGPTGRPAERFAEEGVVACVAAVYFSAFLQKMAHAGLGWDHRVLWHLLYAMGVDGQPIRGPIARAVLDHVALADAIAIATLVIQATAPMMLLTAPLRRLGALLLVLLHVGMFVVAGFADIELTVVMLAIALPWRPLRVLGGGDDGDRPLPGVRPRRRRRAIVVWIALAFSLVAILWATGVRRDRARVFNVQPEPPYALKLRHG